MEPSPSSGYAAWNYTKNPGDENAFVGLPSTVSPVHKDTALRLFSSQNNGITLTPNGNSFITSGNLSLLGSTQATATVQARRFATASLGTNAEGKFQQNTGFSSLSLGSDNTATGSSRLGLDVRYDGSSVAFIKYDGSASFAGQLTLNDNLLIGGTLPSSPNISLNANGSAEFANSIELSGSTQATATVQARRFATASLGTNAEGKFQQNTGFSSLSLGSDNTATGSSRLGLDVRYDGSSVAFIKYDGSASFAGSVSKGSGSFRIDHPLKAETHQLVHSFIEGPQADNIYRGKVDLGAGTAAVNIDTVAGMTEGTFAALNREIQCFTTNETGWTAVKGSVTGNVLTITAQDNTCTDTVSWLVIGERHDQHMYDTEWTDDNGKVIVEPEKPTE